MKIARIKSAANRAKTILVIPICRGPHKVPTNREIIARYAGKPAQ